ncbi:MAG: AAA family ATPase [Pleurocapsa sp.]
MTLILNWLKNKLIEGENGIIFNDGDSNSFSVIQDFIESCDRNFKTPVIYYQAFPEENAVEFLNTLGEELASKLGNRQLSSQQSLFSTIQDAELKMILIDDCHLHPQDTLQNLIDFFSACKVAVILIGCQNKMAIAQILNTTRDLNWDRLETLDKCESIPELR